MLIEHCVFRNNVIGVASSAWEGEGRCCLNDSLFVGLAGARSVGVYAESAVLEVTNCTFDQYQYSTGDDYNYYNVSAAILINTTEFYCCTVLRNVFSRCRFGVWAWYHYYHDSIIDYNGLSNCYQYAYCAYDGNSDCLPLGPHSVTDNSSFETNTNGSYYLWIGSLFRNCGGCPAASIGLSSKTTRALILARIKSSSIQTTETWTRFTEALDDDTTVDLGYHYDPVDYLIAPAAGPLQVSTAAAAIVAEPGITVVFSHAVSSPLTNGIEAKTSGTIIFEGTGSQPIRFTSTLACGDKIGEAGCAAIPGQTPLYGGLTIQNTGCGLIKYCTFENANCGLDVYRTIPAIEGCRFFGCWYGVALAIPTTSTEVTIRNCLLRNIWTMGVYTNHVYPLRIVNSMFYRCYYGVWFGGFGADYHSIHNCILAENVYGLLKYGQTSMGERESHNCFFNNSSNANFQLNTAPPDVFANPQFDNITAPDLYARFYLDQDYSPCVDKGSGLPFMSTALDGWLDVSQVDIGYHYERNLLYVGAVSPRGRTSDIRRGNYDPGDPNDHHYYYPRACQLQDGTVLCAFGDSWDGIRVSKSTDHGMTWGDHSTLLPEFPDFQYFAGWHLTQLCHQQERNPGEQGTLLLVTVYRDVNTNEDDLKIYKWDAQSGQWTYRGTVLVEADLGWILWEPFLLEKKNGELICFFTRCTGYPSNPDDVGPGYIAAMISTDAGENWTGRQSDPDKPIIVALTLWDSQAPYEPESDHKHHGMPWAVELPSGDILAVFERQENWGSTIDLGIRSNLSATEGRSWPTPGDYPSGEYPVVYQPPADKNAGCPNIVQMTDRRLVCSFHTDEDYGGGVHFSAFSEVKAVTSSDWGKNWSLPFLVISQKSEDRYCSWQGLIPLHNDSLLCTFANGPDGADQNNHIKDESVLSTIVDYRPAVFADDFDDGDAKGWSLAPQSWRVDTGADGDRYYDCDSAGMALAGLAKWKDYEMSVDLEYLSSDGKAGIVFHAADNGQNFYYFGVDKTAATCQVWEYYQGQPLGHFPEDPYPITITEPMVLRMMRSEDGSFLFYAGGALLLGFNDMSYSGGCVGLMVETGTAKFDNVTVHGANAFLLNANPVVEAPLIEDPFNHLTLDGTPFMWGLLGEDPTAPRESAWKVVDGGSGHGKVLQGTTSTMGTEAFRGDHGWINDEGETSYMNYFVQADVKLLSATDKAGVCLRVRPYYISVPIPTPPYWRDVYVGDRFYELHLDAAQGKLQFGYRWWNTYPAGHWDWAPLGTADLPNPTEWKTIAVKAIDNTFECYLGGALCFTVTDYSDMYRDGLVGLWVESNAALFDNVKVLDLRQ